MESNKNPKKCLDFLSFAEDEEIVK